MDNLENPGLTDELFRKFTELLFQKCGIALKDFKKYLVINRLSKFIGRGREFADFEEYYEALKKDKGRNLMAQFVNALTTNYSFFFRDKVHFEVLKQYLSGKIQSEPYIHLWSSGCSTGEEPYSMAIVCRDVMKSNNRNPDIRILATDISTRVLEIARKGEYQSGGIEPYVNKEDLKAYFDFEREFNQYMIRQQVKDLVSFRYLNLLDNYPFSKLFDMVFLRNVLIYFDKREKEKIVKKITDYIKPGGYLILGLSETIFELEHDFFSFKNSVYQKK